MVHCLTCYGELPYGCTCKITPEEKLLRYIESVQREGELIIAIRKGFKPKVNVSRISQEGETEKVQVTTVIPEIEKVTDYHYMLSFTVNVASENKIIATLFDTQGNPLYARDIMQEVRVRKGDDIRKGDAITIHWFLGIPQPY
jgi:hypothetical protein